MGERRFFFLPEHGYVGVLKNRHEEGEYISPHNNESVNEVVLEFEDGNCFLDPEIQYELSEIEANCFLALSRTHLSCVSLWVAGSKNQGLTLDLIQAMFKTSATHIQQLLSRLHEDSK